MPREISSNLAILCEVIGHGLRKLGTVSWGGGGDLHTKSWWSAMLLALAVIGKYFACYNVVTVANHVMHTNL